MTPKEQIDHFLSRAREMIQEAVKVADANNTGFSTRFIGYANTYLSPGGVKLAEGADDKYEFWQEQGVYIGEYEGDDKGWQSSGC